MLELKSKWTDTENQIRVLAKVDRWLKSAVADILLHH
jgi:hypothetical protein